MKTAYKTDQPEKICIENEEEILFYKFCTFYVLYKGIKMNFIHIFLSLIANKYDRLLFKKYLSLTNDFEAIKCFLKYAPSIANSKYVTKRINKGIFN